MTTTTQRLTHEMRHEIASKLMATLPSQDTTKWTKRMAELAERARVFGVPVGDLRRLNNMETAWLSTDHRVEVNIGGMLRLNLEFSGNIYHLVSDRARRSYKCPENIYRPVRTDVTCNKKGVWDSGYNNRSVIVIPDTDPLGIEIKALLDEISAAKEEYNTKHSQAWAALEAATTTKKLIEMWPEIAPFVPTPPPPVALPVIQREDLNSAFALPLNKADAKKAANSVVVR